MKVKHCLVAGLALIVVLGLLSWRAFNTAASGYQSKQQKDEAKAAQRAQRAASYGQLPLRFEANTGQTDERVRFLARGSAYTLFLTADEMALKLRSGKGAPPQFAEPAPAHTVPASAAITFRLRFVDANTRPRIVAHEPLTTKSNYFTGSDSRRWQTNVANFARVKYESIYPGIDLVWYGNQQQLEHDFLVGPGADPARIRYEFVGADKLSLDAEGALVWMQADQQMRLLKPVAWQHINGQRRAVTCAFRLVGKRQVRLQLGAYDRTQPLVIDPVLVYATLLGGLSTDVANDIAVDAAGNAYVCGWTASSDFPTRDALQPERAGVNSADVFIAKLNASGSALIYATYLGGNNDEAANSIAVDAAGNAYLAGLTASIDFPTTTGAWQRNFAGLTDAFVAKLNSTGSALGYATLLGGRANDQVLQLALDNSGNVYLTGATEATDFPTVGATTSKSGAPFFKSTNGAANWQASSNGLTVSATQAIALDPSNVSTLYATSNLGLFKSTDGGNQWSFVGAPPVPLNVPLSLSALVIDPQTPTTLYVGGLSGGVYKSIDGGRNFALKNNGLQDGTISTILLDPAAPATLYAGTMRGVYKSTNGGENWTAVNNGLTDRVGGGTTPLIVRRLIFDPTNPATIYAGTQRGIFKTTNSATSWTSINNGLDVSQPGFGPDISALTVDATAPTTLYAASSFSVGLVYKTADGGANWQAGPRDLKITVGNTSFLLNPATLAAYGPNVYAGTALGLFKSQDGGGTWSLSNEGLTARGITALITDRLNPMTIYAATNAGSDAFAAKLDATGAALVYSRYLGGGDSDTGRGIAVDGQGNAWITGQTTSNNFPTVNPLQNTSGAAADAFVTKLNATGATLSFSTYLGGTSAEAGHSVALDAQGNAYVAGWTQSSDFPVVNPLLGNFAGFPADAFVAKYRADGSGVDYATYLGGASDDRAYAIAVDAPGNAYVAGVSASQNFPSIGALPTTNALGNNGFIAQLSPNGARLLAATLLGGNNSEQINGIALDAQGNVYVAGVTTSTNFPTVNPLQPFKGGQDAFVAKLSPAADLVVTMTGAPDPLTLGENLTYTINVKNNGELNATGVMLTDTLPNGATFISANASQGSCSGQATVTCNLGNLAVSATATVTIVIKPPARDKITNTATATGNELDPNPTNNTATLETQVAFTDLAVTNAVTFDRAVPGGSVNWLVTATNLAGRTIDASLTFAFPDGVTAGGCVAEGGTCAGAGNNRIVNFPALAAGQVRSVTFSAAVNNSIAPGTNLTATATIGPTSADPNPSNNIAAASVLITNELLRTQTNGKIVFLSDRSITGSTEPSGIYTINPDGSEARYLPNIKGQSVWSPDGTKLAYLEATFPPFGDPDYGIYVSNPDGSNKVRVANNPATHNSRFSWSPDGRKIVYTSAGFLYIAHADGSGQFKLPGSPSSASDPDWSPDGDKIAYVYDRGIWVFNFDGRPPQRLAAPLHFSDSLTRPHWRPDGAQLLFTRNTNNLYRAYAVNADGTGFGPLLNVLGANGAAWSPDGRQVVYEWRNSLYVVNLDGSRPPTRLTDNLFYNLWPHWQPLPTGAPLVPQPMPETFTISGRILREGIPYGTTVRISGTVNGVITLGEPNIPEEANRYTAVRLPKGGNYTITPEDPAYGFDPPLRIYNNLDRDITDADFIASFRPLKISGRLADRNNAAIVGATVILLGSGAALTTETDSEGRYLFAGLTGGRLYTVQPLGYGSNDLYEPRQTTFASLNFDQTADFIGTREKFPLIAQVSDAGGNPVSGVAVTLTVLPGGPVNGLRNLTDAQGKVLFGELEGGFAYRIQAAKEGVAIAPAERTIALNRPFTAEFFTGVSSVTGVAAASFRTQDVASGGIVALFGSGLAETVQTASEGLAYEVAGVTVTLSTRQAGERPCLLFFVAPTQINLLIPSLDSSREFITGETLIVVRRNGQVVAAGSMPVEKVAPSLYTANATGAGVASAVALRVKADGTQVYEPIAQFDHAQGRFVSVPLDVSDPAEQVFLICFGNGIRNRSDLSAAQAQLGGEYAEVLYAGFQADFAGLDQVNLRVPPQLRGRGEVDVLLTVDGRLANTVKVNIK